MAINYDPNSIVDLLKSQGQKSDLSARADLAVANGLATSREDYISKAQMPGGAVNTALISKLKGTGGQTGSMSTPTAPVNASVPTNSSPGATSTPKVTIPTVGQVKDLTTGTTTPTNTSVGTPPAGWDAVTYANFKKANPTLEPNAQDTEQMRTAEKDPSQIRAEIESKYNNSDIVNGQINGRQVYQGSDGNYYYSDDTTLARSSSNLNPYSDLEKAQKAQNDLYQTQELEKFDLDSKHSMDLLYNNLAARGLLDAGSTEGKRLIDEETSANDKSRALIQDKYRIANMNLSAEIKTKMQDFIQKEIDSALKDRETRISERASAQKAAQDAKATEFDQAYKTAQLNLQEKQAETERKYKEGSITIDQYNAETSRNKAESDAAVNRAQIGKLGAETAKTNAETSALTNPTGQKNPMDSINLVKNSLTNAEKLVGRSGSNTWWEKIKEGTMGNTGYTNLVAETNTLRTNVLTMMTDPSIKKFFGPQMSDADVRLMTSAGTTLNPELQSPEAMKTELTRLRDLVTRAEKAVQVGQSSQSGSGTAGEGDTKNYNGVNYKVINGVWTPQ